MVNSVRALLCGMFAAALVLGSGQIALSEIGGTRVTDDGLVRVEANTRFQRVWVRPGGDLTAYTKVLVLPPEIHYKSPPDTSLRARENFALSSEQLAQLTQALREGFNEEVAAKVGWARSEAPGPNVLVARGGLIGLIVKIPSSRGAVRSASYVRSYGVATLVFELYDSQSMEPLLRIADRQEAEPAGRRGRNSEFSAVPDVTRVLKSWAARLREELAAARAARFPSDPYAP